MAAELEKHCEKASRLQGTKELDSTKIQSITTHMHFREDAPDRRSGRWRGRKAGRVWAVSETEPRWVGWGLQKSIRAGGEVTEAGRGLAISGFAGRRKSLVFTQKAIEVTEES